MKISKEYLPTMDMEHCCNEHDLCYDTCNNDKEMCDLDFRRCLLKICDKATAFGDIGVKGERIRFVLPEHYLKLNVVCFRL